MKTLAKWSVDDYHCMIQAGILRDRHVELLAGEIVEMSPETPIHYSTAKRGAKYLENLLTGQADIRFNGPITLSNSEPEPDIAIVRLPESNYSDRHPAPDDIFFIIEVAHTSLKKDLELKTSLYADANIPEYWILSLSTKEIIVFRYPQNGQYTSVETIAEGTITPLAFPDIQVSVKQLLG
ncbi:Uma2 family endonuclease [Nostoc sp. FACHB-87]|uniref:Uma2 family endonuclease n=1 Tax=Nostocales TaxID=1161 RepID=UPI001687BF2C|nr:MULTISPECIES: Uma2 family endonuclease [Nostocales]MBD2302527.1 Uma2 family endonuclease [Nostoc sp. FACHB-190]MBD2457144.1 Uma2 family endonuclease [Nostoc sp. FACHB-87]MBD2476990.1 Uma2 family endonuclease [Anabaena sp. FACHB-83]MBD2490586.1 Uma2 family endonuclease [Aulosira sp. FACHB-615]